MEPASFQTTPGTRDPRALTMNAPVFDPTTKPEPMTSKDAEVLNVMIEVDDRVLLPLMPPALHTPLPPMVAFVFWVCPESSIGAFKLAQTRIFTRLNARPRGLLLSSYFEGSPATAACLRSNWAFDCRPAKITVMSYFNETVGVVEAGGREILRVSGKDPGAIPPQDVRDMPNCNPIRLRREQAELSRLLQVDTESLPRKATRSTHPKLEQFDGEAWNAPGIRQEYPVRALHYRGEFRIPPARFLIDPALSTNQRSEELAR